MYLYLHELIGCGNGTEYEKYHDLMVELYADFNGEQLLRFLEITEKCTMTYSLQVCENRIRTLQARIKELNSSQKQIENKLFEIKKYNENKRKEEAKNDMENHSIDLQKKAMDDKDREEMRIENENNNILKRIEEYIKETRNLNECRVHIERRLGNFTHALQIILIELKDVQKAVKYVESHDDKSLWQSMIDQTLTNAKDLVPDLLDAVKSHPHVDCKELIEKIPNDLEILQLKQKLTAIFDEYSNEQSLRSVTSTILKTDCTKMHIRLLQTARRGLGIHSAN